MQKKLLLAIFTSSTLLLSACHDDDHDSYVSGDSIPKNNIVNPVVMTTSYTLDDMSLVAADSKLMTYKMLGINNTEVQATALVFTPKGVVPTGGWPIVVWAHGTTGVADECAPSQQGLQGNQYFIQKLLAAGYAVVAPDYEGLGEPRGSELHPFLNLKSEAFSITDAVVAANKYLGNKTEKRWAVVGHSQGGQAALGAAEYASRANLDYVGAIAVAPASNLSLILSGGELKAEAETDSLKKIEILAPLDTFTALITAGLRNRNPQLQYSQVFKSPTDAIAIKAESECYDVLGKDFGNAMGLYASNHSGSLDGYPRMQPNFMTDIPVVNSFLKTDSQPLQKKITTPIYIYQGSEDETVPRQVTDILYQSAVNNGTKIQYITDDGASEKWDHGSVYVNNWDNIISNVQTLMPIQ